jgi:uncharacterized membrane protein
MSYQEKKSIVLILSTILILTIYCIYSFGKYQSGVMAADDLKSLAITMLIFIGAGIVAMIVVQILFHIFLSIGIAFKESINKNECDDLEIEKRIELEMVEDERDKQIQRKATNIGFAVVGVGFIAALLSLVLNATPFVMLNIIFISFYLGSICDNISQFYFYRRGI